VLVKESEMQYSINDHGRAESDKLRWGYFWRALFHKEASRYPQIYKV